MPPMAADRGIAATWNPGSEGDGQRDEAWESPMDTHELEVSVVICTCARRDLAHACIASVVAQREVDRDQVEIVIVDNSPSGYFRDEAAGWARRAPVAITYVHEPARNIARARNAGCRAARGRFIAFIDDDERAAPEWLARLLLAAKTWPGDAVCGPVLPEFDGGKPPDWDPDGAHFRKVFDLPGGAALEVAPTCNLLLRRGTCLLDPAPFDARYGHTGGSDTAFTYDLTRRGRRIVWCPDALVHEFVPHDRMEMGFQLWRTFVQTQNFVRIQLQRDVPLRALVRGGWLMAKGLALMLGALPGVVASVFATEDRVFGLRAPLFFGLGLALWPISIARYR